MQTFDSLDFARYSDDGEKQLDERVAGETSSIALKGVDSSEILCLGIPQIILILFLQRLRL